MKKIFPFYKGKNIANNPLGYTTATNARKRMNAEKVKEDFEKTLPEDYWMNYYYVYELENPWSEDFKPGRYGVSTSGKYCHIDIYTKGYTKYKSDIYLKDAPENIKKLFIELIKITDIIQRDYYNDINTFSDSYEHKQEYREILYSILRNGYMPNIYKDETDYKKRWKKFVTDNVEFKEMDVDISTK